MKPSSFIFFTCIVCVSIGILFYLGGYGLSHNAVPTVEEFLGTTTQIEAEDMENGENSSSTTFIRSSSSIFSSSSPLLPASFSLFHTPSSVFRIQTAKNAADRQHGLSGREKLEPDEGLLFIFPTPDIYGFWMKEMNFPIDIVWIDSSKKVVGISENIFPDTYPTAFFPPKKVQFVLEVNAGRAKSSGLATGTPVSF